MINSLPSKSSSNQLPLISNAVIVKPMLNILEESPQTIHVGNSQAHSSSIAESLEVLFPEQKNTDKNIKKTKEVLGDIAQVFTDDQIKDTNTIMQCLANSWLDDFEKNAFDGVTLQELLHEKGAV